MLRTMHNLGTTFVVKSETGRDGGVRKISIAAGAGVRAVESPRRNFVDNKG
jgi:hypothetical protein